MKTEEWFTVTKIDDSTFALSELGHWEQVHSYLLIGEGEAFLIDTGLGIFDIQHVVEQLTSYPVEVITTHVHWDHIGSHGSFATIYVHEAEADWLKNGIPGLPLEQIRHDVGRDITKPTPNSFNPATYQPFTGSPTALLQDGDRLQAGGRELIVLHTPGHSPGHVCLFETNTGYLFSGDILYSGTPVYAHFPSTDPKVLLQSLQRLSELTDVMSVFGAHNNVRLSTAILDDAGQAASALLGTEKACHGSGLHTFGQLTLQF
ncbi:MBL fold metallo-hydrolase [Salsuginibacillus kocurii]|uniref:MBL fold metallo-hydrolase n=1 Tax=Salsuginibacillus kocurii TaxID=427078 RepID=UPI0003621674|nr:MBL fold metallo-hydrolase [Salsuginibacillus kocurii]